MSVMDRPRMAYGICNEYPDGRRVVLDAESED